jgi:CRP-like cAMP-binding protein
MARAGDVVGEIGVLCYKPQLFTARTRTLCQLLRMERTAFLRIVQANVGDGTIIINNLIQANPSHPSDIEKLPGNNKPEEL